MNFPLFQKCFQPFQKKKFHTQCSNKYSRWHSKNAHLSSVGILGTELAFFLGTELAFLPTQQMLL